MESVPDPGSEQVSGSHSLGPHLVGQRVVVRSVVLGETGPTGGPAFTDVLGVIKAWGNGIVSLQRRDGSMMEIETSLIVSGKAIPPPPHRRRVDGSRGTTD